MCKSLWQPMIYRQCSKFRIRKMLFPLSKVEFFSDIIACKVFGRGIVTQVRFSKFDLQCEKTVLFHHEEIWDDEERFKLRYCLRFLVVFKTQNERRGLSTRYNALMSLSAVLRRFKIALAYLRNSLISDVDRVNSRFLIFLYFLTRVGNGLLGKQGMLFKRKRILRNLFFIFIFIHERLNYFFCLTRDNPTLARRFLKVSESGSRFSRSVFPGGLFLILYSPYKVMYRFGSSRTLLAKYKVFLHRLDYSRDLIRRTSFKSVTTSIGSKQFNYVIPENADFIEACDRVSAVELRINSGLFRLSKLFSKLRIGVSSKRNNYLFGLSNRFLVRRPLARLNRKVSYFSSLLHQSSNSTDWFSSFPKHFKSKLRLSKFGVHINLVRNARRVQLGLRDILRRFFRGFMLFETKNRFFYLRYGKRPSFFSVIARFRLMLRRYYRCFNTRSDLRNALVFSGFNMFLNRVFVMPKKLIQKLLTFNVSFGVLDEKKHKSILKQVTSFGLFRPLNKHKSNITNGKTRLKLIVLPTESSFSNNYAKKLHFSSQNVASLRRLNLLVIFPTIVQFLVRHDAFLGASRTYFSTLSHNFGSFKGLSMYLQTKFFLNPYFIKFFFELLSNYILILMVIREIPSWTVRIAAIGMQFFRYYTIPMKIGELGFNDCLGKFLDSLTHFHELQLSSYSSAFFRTFRFCISSLTIIKFKYIKRTESQVRIIGQHNLRNLESMKESVKRLAVFLRRLSDKKRKISSSGEGVSERAHGAKIRSSVKGTPVKSREGVSGSKMPWMLRKARVGQHFKSSFWRLNFLGLGYRTRRFFRKNVRKLFFRRKIRKFLLNVLFLNKFVKEKRIMRSYYSFARRIMRISRFHKLASSFFLRLRLKRFLLVEPRNFLKRVANRFSFTMLSYGLSAAINKLANSYQMLEPLLLSKQCLNSVFHVIREIGPTVGQGSKLLYRFYNYNNLLGWLGQLKKSYFLLVFRFLELNKIAGLFHSRVKEYILVLILFFRRTGSLVFLKNIAVNIYEFWNMCWFLYQVKQIFLANLLFVSSKVRQNQLFWTRRVIENISKPELNLCKLQQLKMFNQHRSRYFSTCGNAGSSSRVMKCSVGSGSIRKTFKFFFFPDKRFLTLISRDFILMVFQNLSPSFNLLINRSLRKEENQTSSTFINTYLVCECIDFVLSSSSIWSRNFFSSVCSDLFLAFEFFPISLYSFVIFRINSIGSFFGTSRGCEMFSYFAPSYTTGFFTFFYSTIRNFFASYSHFRFLAVAKRFKHRKWRTRKVNKIGSDRQALLLSVRNNYINIHRRQPFYTSFFFRRKIGTRLHYRKLREKGGIFDIRLKRFDHTRLPQRRQVSVCARFSNSRLLNFRSSSISRSSVKNVSSSVKTRSIGFVNILTRPSIFSGRLLFEARREKRGYILNQVRTRMYAQCLRFLKFQPLLKVPINKSWFSRKADWSDASSFGQSYITNSKGHLIMLNLKLQRFCRLFTILSRNVGNFDKSAISASSVNLEGPMLTWDVVVLLFEFIFFPHYAQFNECYMDMGGVGVFSNFSVNEFGYYDEIVDSDRDACICCFSGSSGCDSLDSGVFFWHAFGNVVIDDDLLSLSNAGFCFFNVNSEAVVLDPDLNLPYSSFNTEFSVNSKIIKHEVCGPSFISLTELVKFYMYVFNYKLTRNLTNFIVPLDLVKANFDYTFLVFLQNHCYIYSVKDSATRTPYFLVSELFFVFLQKFFILVTSTLLNVNVVPYTPMLRELLEFLIVLCLNSNNVSRGSRFVQHIIVFFGELKALLCKNNMYFSNLKFLNILQDFAHVKAVNENLSVFTSSLNSNSTLKFQVRRRVMHIHADGRRRPLLPTFVSSSGPPSLGNARFADFRSVHLVDKKGKLVKFLQNYRKKVVKLYGLKSSSRINLFRRGLRQHFRRHKKRFLYQKFFSFMINGKSEVVQNKQLRHLLAYLKVFGRGSFFQFRNSAVVSETKIASIIPSKKKFKKRLQTAYVYNPTQLYQNPYETSSSRRILQSLRAKRVRLVRRHAFIKTRFPLIFKKRIFVDFFVSPRFFNLKNGSLHLYFSYLNFDSTLKNKTGLFFKLNRFLEFLLKLAFRIRLGLRYNTLASQNLRNNVLGGVCLDDKFFMFLFTLYRRVKVLILRFMTKLGKSFVRKIYKSDRTKVVLNFTTSRIRFGFFYNYLSIKFFKVFVLRYFFFGDYIRTRLQFVIRYLWFRVIPLNTFVLNPKVYIIITKAYNNFFITGIDLFGRILYKTSPGIVKFTGTDRMSKYAWFEASVDFFDGLTEFFRYFLKGRRRKRDSFVRWRMVRRKGDRLHGMKRMMGAFFDSRKLDVWKSLKRMKKRKLKQKLKMRRFFVISKGISDFNLRIFRKGMLEQRYVIAKFFAGAVNYPMKSFSLCRIKKVRRI